MCYPFLSRKVRAPQKMSLSPLTSKIFNKTKDALKLALEMPFLSLSFILKREILCVQSR